MAAETHIAWFDSEFTHLDVIEARREEALLLQVACVLTDLDLNVIDDGYQAAIDWGPRRIAAAKATASQVVLDMHTTNGLWDICAGGQATTGALPLNCVNDELFAYISARVERGAARLAGNSLHGDQTYLQMYFPGVIDYLHYRVYDMSTVAGLAQHWSGIPPMQKVRRHTALEDVHESIDEARYYRRRLFGAIPGARPAASEA